MEGQGYHLSPPPAGPRHFLRRLLGSGEQGATPGASRFLSEWALPVPSAVTPNKYAEPRCPRLEKKCHCPGAPITDHHPRVVKQQRFVQSPPRGGGRGGVPSPRGVRAEPRWQGPGKDAGLRVSLLMDFEVPPAVTLWLLEIPPGNGKTEKQTDGVETRLLWAGPAEPPPLALQRRPPQSLRGLGGGREAPPASS